MKDHSLTIKVSPAPLFLEPPRCYLTRFLYLLRRSNQSSNTLELYPGTSLPTGSLVPSAVGTSHDHRSGKTIGDNYPEKGFDDFYLFDDKVYVQSSFCVHASCEVLTWTHLVISTATRPLTPLSSPRPTSHPSRPTLSRPSLSPRESCLFPSDADASIRA